MLFRPAYPTLTNTFAALRPPPKGDRDKDTETPALRHQITVLERRLGVDTRVRFAPEDRLFLLAVIEPGTDRRPEHMSAGPARWRFPRVLTCRVNCLNAVHGRRKVPTP
ncbi:hypothetical protein GCM10010517_63380 [Streptosporangium fragile]|uniref:Uncharacterized protein n=1 Tax=Streptosporangium fragile TaxID=46186 RepID=A0ABP6IPX2_9ACTN